MTIEILIPDRLQYRCDLIALSPEATQALHALAAEICVAPELLAAFSAKPGYR
jgi:hypothetical protein